jgi:hypothetical protein
MSKIVTRLKEVEKRLDQKRLVDHAHKFFVSVTPKATGNARKKTTKTNDSIVADYAYAQRLEQGYSRQAPQGMSKPTIEEIRKQIKG